MAGLLFPKPRPRKLEKLDRTKIRETLDRAENAKVKARSGGRCEMAEMTPRTNICSPVSWKPERCARRAIHIHHKLSGIGVRGRGPSALAENKLHVCQRCHSDIHAHVLVPDGQFYRRVK